MASSSLPGFEAGSQVQQKVEAASRRRMWMEGLQQSGWAAIFLLAGLIVLMLAGSAIFDWYWLVLLGVAGAAFAAYRIQRRLLPRYAVAQILDRRLGLSDTLSTAYHLRSGNIDKRSEAQLYQLEQADRLAAGVEPGQSFPFAGQRVWWIVAVLAVASMALFGVRYLVTESLSLRPAMVSLQISPIIEHIQEILSSKKKKEQNLNPAANQERSKAEEANGKDAQNRVNPEAQPTPPPSIANAAADGSPAGQQTANDSAKAGNEGDAQAKPGDASASRQQNGKEPGATGLPQPGDAQKKADATQQQAQTKEQRSGNQNSSPGVVSRMKEALSSMMAKMQASSAKQEAKGGQQESADSKSSQQAQASGRPQQGNQAQQQAQNQASNPNESAEGQAQGQTAEKQGTSQGKSSDQSAQKGADAHSGVGQQDGDKDIKDAEQLKAMGKLAEIIGRRSANLTGDMTAETSSGKQQLKTSYSQKLGAHSDSGGEINHNQVPLAYQPYVREYMEQVRKQEKNQ